MGNSRRARFDGDLHEVTPELLAKVRKTNKIIRLRKEITDLMSSNVDIDVDIMEEVMNILKGGIE